MKWIVHDGSGRLRVEDGEGLRAGGMGLRGKVEEGGVANPWAGGWLAGRAVHELLFDPALGHYPPGYLAMLVASQVAGGTVVWCDPFRLMYPPAWEGVGGELSRLCVLHPRREDVVWTVAECLACPGVSVTVANVPARLTRVEARRLQLAAERGGGIGVFLRPRERGSEVYAAATRWLVSPASPRTRGCVQAWRIEWVHGQGRLGQVFLLERRRAVPVDFKLPGFAGGQVPLHLSSPLVDRPAASARAGGRWAGDGAREGGGHEGGAHEGGARLVG